MTNSELNKLLTKHCLEKKRLEEDINIKSIELRNEKNYTKILKNGRTKLSNKINDLERDIAILTATGFSFFAVSIILALFLAV